MYNTCVSGEKGYPGSGRAVTGPQGEKGLPGFQGDSGWTGLNGINGRPGLKGPKGDDCGYCPPGKNTYLLSVN